MPGQPGLPGQSGFPGQAGPQPQPGVGQGGLPGQPLPDHAHAQGIADVLQNALSKVGDPALKESLSNALSSILKHISGIRKEHQDALAGKFSPRLLEQAYSQINPGGAMLPGPGAAQASLGPIGNTAGPAHLLAAEGQYGPAAQQWIARHPFALSHGNIPGFVSQWLTQADPQTQAAAYTTAPARVAAY